MSKQWGSGFHTGAAKGVDSGLKVGEVTGALKIAEPCWYVISAAITALEKGDDMEALWMLRMMQFMLADATGRDVPQGNANEGAA